MSEQNVTPYTMQKYRGLIKINWFKTKYEKNTLKHQQLLAKKPEKSNMKAVQKLK